MTDPKNNNESPEQVEDQPVDLESNEQAETETEQESNNPAAELEAAQIEIGKLKDAFLRSKAEEENIRRRAEKDIANGRKFAVEGFAKEMVNVFDSLKLAASTQIADDADDAIKNIHEGVAITLKQLQSGFAKFSLQEIAPAVGDKLDPNLHQAMTMVESQELDSGCVVNVIQSGFQLHERVIRPAMVVVAK